MIGRPPRSTRTDTPVPSRTRVRSQASCGALLSGDRAALEQHYAVHAEGTRRKWKLTLTPTTEPLAEKLRDFALYGRGIELRCLEPRPTAADTQRPLLHDPARPPHQINRVHVLVALCSGDRKTYPTPAPRHLNHYPIAP